jgi:hypothetical protein
MSRYGYCPVGGEDGILVTTDELDTFADVMKSNALDEYIPLPDLDPQVQKKKIEQCTCSDDHDVIYWERENGSHGWCCSNCGTVVQWG